MSDVAITPEETRSTAGAVIDQGFLSKRPLTSDEIELVRKSDWIRQEPVDQWNNTFAVVHRVHPQSDGYFLQIVQATEQGMSPPEVRPIFRDEARAAIDVITRQFDATKSIYAAAGEAWGEGWPKDDPKYGGLQVFHATGAGIPTAKSPRAIDQAERCVVGQQ